METIREDEHVVRNQHIQNYSTQVYIKTIALASAFIISTIYIIYVALFGDITTTNYTSLLILYIWNVLYIVLQLKIFQAYIAKYVLKFFDIFQEDKYRDTLNSIILLLISSFIIYQCFVDLTRLYPVCFGLVLITLSIIYNIRNVLNIKWSVVVRSFNMHFILALLLFYFPLGRKCIYWFGQYIVKYLSYSKIGATFIFGQMLMDQYVFAFYVLSSIYLSFVTIAILRYLRIFDSIAKLSFVLSFCLGITPIEGICGTFNIFLSMTETCIVIRKRIKYLSLSEIFSLMVLGLSTVSFTALFGYIVLGADIDYLIISSIISIPCAFGFSKIFYPNDEVCDYLVRSTLRPITNMDTLEPSMQPPPPLSPIYAADPSSFAEEGNVNALLNNDDNNQNLLDKNTNNFFDVFMQSVIDANFVIRVIIGTIIAVMSFVACLDEIVKMILSPVVEDMGMINCLVYLISKIIPFMGIDESDASLVAQMYVNKVMINEFTAFTILGKNIKQIKSVRTIAMVNIMLCGFGNISAAGMLTSIIYSLTNNSIKVSNLVCKSLLVACIVNIYCACTIAVLI